MKVANASGFWGDDNQAALEIVEHVPDIDFITFDYLAELSLSIMAIQKEKNPELGYAKDFIEVVGSLEGKTKAKLIANAGGLNPLGLKKALERVTKRKIAAVYGDDVLKMMKEDPLNPLFNNLDSGDSLIKVQNKLKTANVYLGADPIVQALKAGAEIVITGRVADPSLTLACAIYAYGWKSWDLLAQGTIAGHLIECGRQVTGGLWTHYEKLKEKPGFPIVEFEENGQFVVTSYSGAVNLETVKEQLLYEMGDPSAYISPDVTVSILDLKLEDLGKRRVKVSGAKGYNPTKTYKVSATYSEGYRSEGELLFIGKKGKKRAETVGKAILSKIEPEKSRLDVIADATRAYLRLAAYDKDENKLKAFVRSFAPFVTSGPPGTTGYTGGRAQIKPVFGYWPCLFL
ncbi:MAG: acyclic terpene utilization AtuA family protein, partial [Parachlamydiaceae bacterium]